jgi:DNA-directed RNA polymerase subunit alpha
MPVKYGRFEMPEKIKIESTDANPNFARFIVEPLERGFGHTLGNTFRRLLLNSLEAISIVSFRIEGVPHEFMPIEGIIEDMTEIILNLKGSLLSNLSFHSNYEHDLLHLTTELDITQEILEQHKGQYRVTLQDLVQHPEIEIINPEHYIFSITVPMKKVIDLRIGVGRGYSPSERIVIPNKLPDEIVIDAAFSPVKMANYYVENTRVGQDTDYDRLIIEINTDGRITPIEAISFAIQIAMRHLELFREKLPDIPIVFDTDKIEEITDFDQIMSKLILRIDEIELSVRSTNCLKTAEIVYLGELVIKTRDDMLAFKNFGKKSLNEIEQKLHEMGLYLGMNLTKYDSAIQKETIKDFIEHYIVEKGKHKQEALRKGAKEGEEDEEVEENGEHEGKAKIEGDDA